MKVGLLLLLLWPGGQVLSRVRSVVQEAKRVWSDFARGDTCSLEADLDDLLRDLGLRLAYGQSDNRCCWIERVPCEGSQCYTSLWYSCNEKKFYWDRREISGPACKVLIVGDWQYQRRAGECSEAPPGALCKTGCNSSTSCVLEDALYAIRDDTECDCPDDPDLNRFLNLFHYHKTIRYECLCPPPQFGG